MAPGSAVLDPGEQGAVPWALERGAPGDAGRRARLIARQEAERPPAVLRQSRAQPGSGRLRSYFLPSASRSWSALRISYAVFCLKKKKKANQQVRAQQRCA